MRAWLVDDPSEVLARAAPHLEADPVANNLLLTLLCARVERPLPGNYAWVEHEDDVVGVLLQSPVTYAVIVSPMPRAAVAALVEVVAVELPGLPGVNADAATAAAFAGEWATRRRCRVEPVEGQRLYRCDRLVEPPSTPGVARRATDGDLELLVGWTQEFERETNITPAGEDPVAEARALAASRDLWLWETDARPVCMVGVTRPLAGVGRIGPVFTPTEHRGRGFAAALTAHGTRQILDAGNVACLYTQLTNPTSNAVYQRLGYEAVSEIVRYSFG